MPSHLGALLANPSYTNLALDPAGARGAIDISNPRARALLRSLVAEYLPLFPGPYFSIGADEYITNHAKYPPLQAYARTCNAGATPKTRSTASPTTWPVSCASGARPPGSGMTH